MARRKSTKKIDDQFDTADKAHGADFNSQEERE